MGLFETESLFIGVYWALSAGALSVLSPCLLPILPAFLSYLSGISQEDKTTKSIYHLFIHGLFFILGVSFIFISLGASATFFGQWFQHLLGGHTGLLLQRIGGLFMMIMGLFMLDWLQIPSLMRDWRVHSTKKPTHYLGSLLVGLAFAAGWTPCIGPIFGSILWLAALYPAQGLLYTFVYVLGFIIPFVFLIIFIEKTSWLGKYSTKLHKLSAILMILMGLTLFFGLMPYLSRLLIKLIQDTWLGRLG
ncbi:cytochrome c-type biogenesis protein [Amphibacillus marinus]|uniref:Cytochrome c-type biogenesis protein n=1 Tax=Amphibacillus marinus TaxID=872970 RepID=A0A1H8IXB9_9BACI|nr:cytochrome c biogenesis protein CcdA [Amphibacillus marinus]SEN72577.1 cytochrome c-type biogenesis protein [Amphibacillus marinus]